MKSLRSPQTVACFLMCVCTLVLTTLISGHAQSGSTIYACAKRNNGQLRVVSSAGQCNSSEYEISWSSASGGSSFTGHLQKTTVIMNYGESHIITLPEDNRPTMVNICSTPVGGNDGITISPPRAACVNGLYYRDSADGRTVSTTVHFENTGNFGAGGMQLELNDGGQLMLSNLDCNDCGITPATITYHVDMWY